MPHIIKARFAWGEQNFTFPFEWEARQFLEVVLMARECISAKIDTGQDRTAINEAIKAFHVERGCCDGTFIEPCPWKDKQKETVKKEATISAKADWETFKNAEITDAP